MGCALYLSTTRRLASAPLLAASCLRRAPLGWTLLAWGGGRACHERTRGAGEAAWRGAVQERLAKVHARQLAAHLWL